jgi:hypothetical protein
MSRGSALEIGSRIRWVLSWVSSHSDRRVSFPFSLANSTVGWEHQVRYAASDRFADDGVRQVVEEVAHVDRQFDVPGGYPGTSDLGTLEALLPDVFGPTGAYRGGRLGVVGVVL